MVESAEEPLSDYREVLGRVQALIRPPTYLEIGVESGRSLARAQPPTLALAVDPAMNVSVPFQARTKIFPLTSDQFFRDCDLREELEGLPVDLAFIDGLHEFEQALPDFINTERWCTPGSVILMHDCLPRDRETSSKSKDPTDSFWTGDVWKVVPCLIRYRPDLLIRTLTAPPAGLAVIRNLDRTSTVLQNMYGRICEEYAPLDFDDLVAAGKNETLRLVGHDWLTVRRTLGATGIRPRIKWWLRAHQRAAPSAYEPAG